MLLIVKQNLELVNVGVFISLIKKKQIRFVWFVGKMVKVRRSPVSSSTHLRASHLSVPATVFAGGFCGTKWGTVYFLCAIYTKSIKATQNWQVAGRSCVSHRSCSVDLDETWNWRYTLTFRRLMSTWRTAPLTSKVAFYIFIQQI